VEWCFELRVRIEYVNRAKIGGGSYGITIPIEIIRKFGWKERQKVLLKADPKKKSIVIKDWKS